MSTHSLTEAELVGVDDVMIHMIRADLFIKAQRYTCTTCLHQDNKATAWLHVNAERSSGQPAHHLNIKYLYVTHKIE